MQNSALRAWWDSSCFYSINQNWIERLYEDFLINPNLVDASWRSKFKKLSEVEISSHNLHPKIHDNCFDHLSENSELHNISTIKNNIIDDKRIKILQLIDAYRFYGHQCAKIDPLSLQKKERILNLDPKYHGLNANDYQKIFDVSSLGIKQNKMMLGDLIQLLEQIYCGSIGIEYMHISSIKEKKWIQQYVESSIYKINFSNDEKKYFLKELIAAEELEHYLGKKFPGAKRFSLEGGETLVPILNELIYYSSTKGVTEIVMGMAHRGRLNVLVNIFGKKSQDLFDEFVGKNKVYFGSGDVKYHMGYSSDIIIKNKTVHLSLMFNPSHLEIINPVVTGSARARLDRIKRFNNNIDNIRVLPITIHGDAAIISQGVVQETLNMSKVRGYEVGGTIRIVINNQIGFTTSNLKDVRSTLYCTDIGKMIEAPILHVNADDPEAAIFTTRLALDFRNTFKRDVFIDLVCYRRHGHNEADDPTVTQPIMYKKIKRHPTSREIYAKKLEKENLVTSKDINKMIDICRNKLDHGKNILNTCYLKQNRTSIWSSYKDHEWDKQSPVKLEIKILERLARCITSIPKHIKMQSRVEKIYNDRLLMAMRNKLLDWGFAENLAYATLVNDGISVRISGEDSSRGTFFHRHAVIHSQDDGSIYIPLQHISPNQGKFEIWDSLLSEEAVLAFEYGYAISEPRSLIIWEAQFGDFANGAQIVIDQFIASGEQKWDRMCGLVMFLPHGYEGQGPEHSSARLERYLQLCAEQNMKVCIPSTSAQIYHILRLQALCKTRRPLIVMSPKSLLRHHLAVSSLDELSSGTFLPVINEVDQIDSSMVKCVIMCSGKIYYDLLEQRRKNNQKNVAILRIEQLYPFPHQEVLNALKSYSHVDNFIWCQEEPINQGAWNYIQYYFNKITPFGYTLRCMSRPASAAPAVGNIYVHQKQQQILVKKTLDVN